MYSLSAGTFQQVVDHRYNQQLVVDSLQLDQTFVGVDNLLQVGILIRDKGEAMVIIILLINTLDLGQVNLAVDIGRSKDAAREIAANRNKVDSAGEAVLQLT